MTLSLPLARRATKCLVPGASMILLCNEGTGTTVLDYSGNGNNATLGGTTYTPTWTATGLGFAGGQFVTGPDLNGMTTGLTVTVVAKGNLPAMGAIVSKASSSGATGTGWNMQKGGDPEEYRFLVYDGNGNAAHSEVMYANDTWGIFTGVADGATARLYANEIAGTPVACVGLTETTARKVILGRLAYTSSQFFTGDIAAVLIYPRALTEAEVQQNAAALRAMMTPREIAIPRNGLPEAVLFTFDDVASSIYTEGFPIHTAAGVPATCYTAENIVGGDGLMTLAQYQEVYADGWDVGNHTSVHADLTLVDAATQQARLEAMDAYLVANGMPRGAKHVAYPVGATNADTLTAMAAAGMYTGRKTEIGGDIVTPITAPYLLPATANLYATTRPLATAKASLWSTRPNRIVIYLCHNLDETGSDTSYSAADYAELVDYVKVQGCRVVTISQLWDYMQAGYVWP